MFRTDLLSSSGGICHTSYVDCLLTWLLAVNIASMTNTYCCEYSIKTPDDGQ